MKTLFTLTCLFVFVCLTTQAQFVPGQYVRKPLPYMAYQGDWTGGDLVASPNRPHPRDPLRQLGDTVWKVTGKNPTNGWVVFQGKVVEVQPHGVRIMGFFTGYGDGDGDDFFVENFPYVVAENDHVGWDDKTQTYFCAKLAGSYTYTTVMGGSRTIRKLDYGKIYTPPPPPPLTPEQIAATKKAEVERRSKTAANTVKWLEDLADKGDAYAELRLGQRYLTGQDVEKDEAKARGFLMKASSQGNKEATELLRTLASNEIHR